MSYERRQISALQTRLDEHPDVMPEERVQVTSTLWLLRALTLAAALLTVPVALLAGLVASAVIGGAGGVLAIVGMMGGIAACHGVGTKRELRYLEGVVRRVDARRPLQLASTSASHSSAAVPSMVSVDR